MAKPRRDREFWESAKYNNYSYIQYYDRLTELAVSVYDWQNLPDTIDPRYMELVLFTDGKAVFFYDEVLGYLVLRCAAGGPLTVYREPINRHAYAANGYNRSLTMDDSVIIWNNKLRKNSMLDVELFASRLSDLDRSIDVNAKAQKTPVLITCEESEVLTLKNTYMKYDGNQPVIFGDKKLSPNSLQAISTGAPYVADRLYELKTQIWNEALTYLGIPNVNITKKERLITDEVDRNQGGTIASRYSKLEMRQTACEKINKMFGLNIWVDFKDESLYNKDSDENDDYADEEEEVKSDE